MTMAFGQVLEEISNFPLQDQEMILAVLEKRVEEEKREILYGQYKEALNDYKKGNVKTGSVDDLFASIDD